MKTFTRRNVLQTVTFAGAASLLPRSFAQETVKLGILHSLTGTIAIAEASIVDAEKMAIEEINAAGGVLGRKIEPVIEDGASDWPTFAEKTKKLLQRDKVAAIIGCYTSASRKAVLPALNQFNGARTEAVRKLLEQKHRDRIRTVNRADDWRRTSEAGV